MIAGRQRKQGWTEPSIDTLHGQPGHGQSNVVIELWVVALSVLRQSEHLICQLSDDEEQRACAMATARAAADYRYSRALLRRLLATRLACAPLNIAFEYGGAGKPTLAQGPAFNLSHSRSCLTIAIAHSNFRGRLGVDVEELVNPQAATSLPARCFAEQERLQLQSYREDSARCAAFTRGWARKEALIKAEGSGLSLPLQNFVVSLDDHRAFAGRSLLTHSAIPCLVPEHCALLDPGPWMQNELAVAVMFDGVARPCKLVRRDPGLSDLALIAADAHVTRPPRTLSGRYNPGLR